MRIWLLLTLVLWSLFTLGCSSYTAPIVSREQPPSEVIKTHLVEKGDTLYSVAWRYDSSVEILARVNGLGYPYILKQGQILSLDTAGVKISKSLQADRIPNKTASKHSGTSVSAASVAKVSAKNLPWQLPVKGKVVESYNPKDLRKGIIFAATSDFSVRPAAKGVVVYAGDGLRDYGKLVIIKHSGYLLSAYGYNQQLLVSEGQVVDNGDIISKLGSNGRLYFEIRKDGKPVNPMSYLD